MKRKFREVNLKPVSMERVLLCNEIIASYQAQDLRLTLRQLYYQLVTRNAIPNAEKSYKALSSLVSDARLGGFMDWDAIEDRVRQPWREPEFQGLSQLADAALKSYRLPRWRDQDNYVELWVEKDALAGVLRPLASEFHVTLMVNRGYSSQSAMYESAARFKTRGAGKFPFLFYLGDHDPSGEDMVRDVAERLAMFGVNAQVEKLALTMDQVKQYDPPPNPAKVTDPRAAEYIAKYGDESWEVDALPPETLSEIIRDAFSGVVDQNAMDAVIAQEESDKDALREAVKGLRGDQ